MMYTGQVMESDFHDVMKGRVLPFLEAMQVEDRKARLGCAQESSIQHEKSIAMTCLFSVPSSIRDL